MSADAGSDPYGGLEFVEPSVEPKMNILLYGGTKTGKTVGAASAPGRVLYINADLKNATRYVQTRLNADGRIKVLRLPKFQKGNSDAVLNTLYHAYRVLERGVFDSVVVDPVGDLHRRLLEENAQRRIRPKIDAYGDVSAHVERFCRSLCEELEEVNVVLVCHELTVQDGEELRVIPFTGTKDGSPVLGQKLMAMVDIVGYTGVVLDDESRKHYVAQLFPAKGRQGGDRFDCLGDLREVNIAEWIETIKADEVAGHEPAQPTDVSTLIHQHLGEDEGESEDEREENENEGQEDAQDPPRTGRDSRSTSSAARQRARKAP